MSIADNIVRIEERIAAAAARAGRSADEVTLVAVAKTFSAERIREAYAAGLRHFGENRVQEWEGKAAQLGDLRDAIWHLVGHLQSNKVRRGVELFRAIDSVDSLALAQRLDRIVAESFMEVEKAHGIAGADLPSGSPRMPILIEVRLAPEETKQGVEPGDLPALVDAVRALPHLELRGLMCIPPWCENSDDARPYFRRLRELRDTTQAGRELSMGMSHDFEVAIEAGATQVRIGTAIFGGRDSRGRN